MLSLTVADAKLQYIRNWQALQDFGITYFVVKVGRNKKEVRLTWYNNIPVGQPGNSACFDRIFDLIDYNSVLPNILKACRSNNPSVGRCL